MINPIEATWTCRTSQVDQSDVAPVERVNRALLSELLSVSGRYINCIQVGSASEIRFRYTIRREDRGFLKVEVWVSDTAPSILVVGCDCRQYPVEQFLSIAEKYLSVAEIASFTPAVVFGLHGQICFYIESLYGLSYADAYFILASHNFIARLLAVYFRGDRTQLHEYIERLSSGEDPMGLLEWEPLMRMILKALPNEVKQQFFQQLGTELQRILDERSRSNEHRD